MQIFGMTLGALDQCEKEMEVGTELDRKNRGRRWYYEWRNKTCNSFEFLGDLGNSNNFPTRDECEVTCARKSCVILNISMEVF